MNPQKYKSDSRQSVPDLVLEKFHLKELNEVDTARLNDRLDARAEDDGQKSDCKDRLMALAASDQRILEEYPPDLIASQIKRHVSRQPRPYRIPGNLLDRLASWVPKPQLAFALLILVPVGIFVFQGKEDGTRVKGGSPFITIYKKAGDSFERLGSNVVVKEHDVLQVSYVAFDAKFGAIFSVDGSGKLTLHYPESRGAAAALIATGEVILPTAFELDNSPAFERFIFVTSQTSFDTREVINSFQPSKVSPATFELKLPKSLTQYSVLLKKYGAGHGKEFDSTS